MPLKSSLAFLLAASAALPATAALAADYEPPVFVDEAPEYTPVEVGSGWYLRGDVGYNFEKGFQYDRDFASFRGNVVPYESEDENFGTGSVGIGYHWTDWLRTDLNLGILAGNEVNASFEGPVSSAEAKVENDAWYGMANIYADLGTVVGFTPYVGAGVGFLRNEWKGDGTFTDSAGIRDADISGNQYTLAYTLNAGVSYALGSNFLLDVGYQYFNAPNAEYIGVADYDTYLREEGLEFQQIRAGLRYDLW